MWRAYVDESGIIAISAKMGHFMALVALVVRGDVDIKRIIKRARKRMGKKLRQRHQLHASRTDRAIVQSMLIDLANKEVEIFVVVIDKRETAGYMQDREELYNASMAQLIQRVLEHHPEIELTIHRRHGRLDFRKRLEQAILKRARIISQARIHAIQQLEARSCQELQIADAVAWAIFQKYSRGDARLYKIIKRKIVVEEMFEAAEKKRGVHPHTGTYAGLNYGDPPHGALQAPPL